MVTDKTRWEQNPREGTAFVAVTSWDGMERHVFNVFGRRGESEAREYYREQRRLGTAAKDAEETMTVWGYGTNDVIALELAEPTHTATRSN